MYNVIRNSVALRICPSIIAVHSRVRSANSNELHPLLSIL